MGQRAEARRVFGDLLAMHDLRSADGRQLVEAAADLLVAGIDGPAVVELASMVVSPLTSPFEFDALVRAARDELTMPILASGGTALRAAQGQLRRRQSGLLTDREMARWAHRAIGHEGDGFLQDLVVLDDMFDEPEWNGETPESIHAELERIAGVCLASPDPWSGG